MAFWDIWFCLVWKWNWAKYVRERIQLNTWKTLPYGFCIIIFLYFGRNNSFYKLCLSYYTCVFIHYYEYAMLYNLFRSKHSFGRWKNDAYNGNVSISVFSVPVYYRKMLYNTLYETFSFKKARISVFVSHAKPNALGCFQ